ncbi:phage integrase family protein [Paraburkholderia unamae]|uniref:tyrosine-type recombinase/integrase n=1 Tax=Paraburkholderia unamae TaxID=219649 RepID=UPI000DC43106|nr:tyrosine-type recombinase/integrase [Paraburkholderia unamae]RAR67096.1 phage integrase family protein [Paraburkholderia unamae]
MSSSVILKKTQHYWELDVSPLYEGETARISWRTFLPAHGGTRHQRTYLLQSVKGLFDALIEQPRQVRGGHISHNTVINWTFEIRRLIRWMTERGIWRFSSLTGQDLADYIERCAVLESGDGPVTQFTLYNRVKVLQEMWELRTLYLGALRVSPATLDVAAQARPLRSPSSWRALDETVAKPLLGDAINFLNVHGDYLVSITQRRWKLALRGLTGSHQKYRIGQFYKSIQSEPEFEALCRDLKLETHQTWKVLQKAYREMDGASYIIILFLVGMRVAELARLDMGCVKHETTKDGVDVARLHGVAAKKGGKSRKWIVNDDVLKAVKYFEDTYAAARKSFKSRALILAGSNRIAALGKSRGIRIARGEVANCMVAFARGKFRKTYLRERVHPHVARKTFARFVTSRDKSGLEALAYHYGHVYKAVTDGSYGGSDIELRTLLNEESRKDLERALTDLIRTNNVAGKAGAAMKSLKEKAKFRGKKGLKFLVEKLIAQGIQLAPCNWGYCVYSRALSLCGGDDRGPNEVNRSADICSRCGNFAATERHRPWWEVRMTRDENFLKNRHLGPQTIKIVGERLRNTATVLRGLNAQTVTAAKELEFDHGKDSEA